MATTGLGPLAAVDSADRAAREEHIARAKASSRACRALNLAKKEGQVGTRYGLRRVFEQERRPFMLAIKELRPPAAACARSDRRQSREVRAVGRGRAQCDGLSEDGCAPRVSRVWALGR